MMKDRLVSLFHDLKNTVFAWQSDDCGLMAAAVAYYGALSIFPLLLVLISSLGLFLEYSAAGADAQAEVLSAIGERTSPEVEQEVRSVLSGVRDNAPLNGPVGIISLMLAAMVLFAQFEQAFDRIWQTSVTAKSSIVRTLLSILLYRLRAFLMLASLGGILVIVFVAGMVMSGVRSYTQGTILAQENVWWFAELALSLLVNTLAISAIYRFLPKAPVKWTEALQGGLLAAVTWEAGRLILARFIIGTKFATAYGVVGSFIALLLWIYYACAVIFLGAEFVQVICRKCSKNSDSSNKVDSLSPPTA